MKFAFSLLALLLTLSTADAENWNANKTPSPVLTATQSWEQGAVYEPRVFSRDTCLLVASPCLAMWYTGGWTNCALGYAESPLNSAGAGGAVWTKHTGQILGYGIGGVAGAACHKNVQRASDGSYRIYFASASAAPATSDLMVVSTPDGVTAMSTPTIAIAHDQWSPYLCCGEIAELDGKFYYLLGQFQNGLWNGTFASGPTFDGPWIKALPYATLPLPAQFSAGAFGPHQLYKTGSVFHSWAFGAPNGNAPSYIYHVCSTILWTWTIANSGNPVMTITLPWEGDQVADASLVPMSITVGGVNVNYVYLYYDGTNNSAQTASIGLSYYQGTMSSLTCP